MFKKWLANHWRGLVIILVPLLFLPLPIVVGSAAAKCGYVILVMATYWTFEAVHMAATALIPIFAFPLLGLLSTNEVSQVFMTDTNMLFLGGLAIAVAVEHCGMHERIALFILLKIGCTQGRLLFGFMLSQMFLSMWISNTAATAMMVPVVDALLRKIDLMSICNEDERGVSSCQTSVVSGDPPTQDKSVVSDDPPTQDKRRSHGINAVGCLEEVGQPGTEHEIAVVKNGQINKLRDIIYLGIAYSSNIGGTGTLTGTNPNLVLMGFLTIWYEEQTGINYATWLGYNVSGMLVCTLLGFCWLRIILYFAMKGDSMQHTDEAASAVRSLLKKKLEGLGPVSFHEKTVAILFIATIALWIFQKPKFIDGWGDIMEKALGVKISAATPAMFIVFLLFVMPSKSPFTSKEGSKGEQWRHLGCLTWDVVHRKLPWGVIVLVGSGFTLAECGKKSGLSAWLGGQFKLFGSYPKELTLLFICVVTALLTEVMSNTATSSILLPVLNDMAIAVKVHPLYFLLPVTLCSSYAFMLPVGTPPNAIVFDAAKTMPITKMIKAGILMNIICVLVAFLLINTLGVAMFDLSEFPIWANRTSL